MVRTGRSSRIWGVYGLTNGSSGSSLGCGTSSTPANFPWPYRIVLFDAVLANDNLFVEAVMGLKGSFDIGLGGRTAFNGFPSGCLGNVTVLSPSIAVHNLNKLSCDLILSVGDETITGVGPADHGISNRDSSGSGLSFDL